MSEEPIKTKNSNIEITDDLNNDDLSNVNGTEEGSVRESSSGLQSNKDVFWFSFSPVSSSKMFRKVSKEDGIRKKLLTTLEKTLKDFSENTELHSANQ